MADSWAYPNLGPNGKKLNNAFSNKEYGHQLFAGKPKEALGDPSGVKSATAISGRIKIEFGKNPPPAPGKVARPNNNTVRIKLGKNRKTKSSRNKTKLGKNIKTKSGKNRKTKSSRNKTKSVKNKKTKLNSNRKS